MTSVRQRKTGPSVAATASTTTTATARKRKATAGRGVREVGQDGMTLMLALWEIVVLLRIPEAVEKEMY